MLSADEKAIVAVFRKHMLLSLDDCRYALQPNRLKRTKSALRRCLQRKGIFHKPEIEGVNAPTHNLNTCLMGFFHIGFAQVQIAEGKLYLFVGVNRTTEVTFTQRGK